MPRDCKNHPDTFCYVCGSFTPKSQKRNITGIQKIYRAYFDCTLGDQDKAWAARIICTACSSGLHDWLNRRKNSMPFAIPMIWREPRDHHADCYFCTENIAGFFVKNKHKIIYPNLESARRPIPHDDTLPVPVPQLQGLESIEDDIQLYDVATGGNEGPSTDHDFVFEGSLEPKTFTQDELNDLVRDLALSKEKSELLASRLKEKNLLGKNVLISNYRKRNLNLTAFFTVDGPLCYCHDVNGLFTCLSQVHIPAEWRLFIDSSERSLKAVLLHNGNVKPCIPIAHSVHLKESYENMNTVLEAIQYQSSVEHLW